MSGPTRLGSDLVYQGSSGSGTSSGTEFLDVVSRPGGGFVVEAATYSGTSSTYTYQFFDATGAASSAVITGPTDPYGFSLSYKPDGTLLASVLTQSTANGPYTETVSTVAANGSFTPIYSVSIPAQTSTSPYYQSSLPTSYGVVAAKGEGSFAVLHQTGSSSTSSTLDIFGSNDQLAGSVVIASQAYQVTAIQGGRYLVTWAEGAGTTDPYNYSGQYTLKGELIGPTGSILSQTTLATTSNNGFYFTDIAGLENGGFIVSSQSSSYNSSGSFTTHYDVTSWSTSGDNLVLDHRLSSRDLTSSSTATSQYSYDTITQLTADRLLYATSTGTNTQSGSFYSVVGTITELSGNLISDPFNLGSGLNSYDTANGSSTSHSVGPFVIENGNNYFIADNFDFSFTSPTTPSTSSTDTYSYSSKDTLKLFDASTVTTTHDDVMRIPVGTGEFDGGAGRDVAEFSLASSAYTWTRSGADTVVVGHGLNAKLSHMEVLRFADGDVSIAKTKSDFNGDGTNDILLQNGGSVVAWTMKDGVYQSGALITDGAVGYKVVGKGDFNADGTNDILLQNGGSVVEWTMKNGAYQSGRLITDGATGYDVVGTGDFNGDGTADILLQSGGSVVAWTMKDGAYLSGRLITDGAVGYKVVGTGDFNGDGTDDILLQNGGSVVAWTMKDGAYQSGRLITDGAVGYKVVGTGDFNADGTDDILLQNGGSVVAWTMKNGAYLSGALITDGATGYAVRAVGDLNGDGTDDVVLQSGGTVVDWIMKDGHYQTGHLLTSGLQGYDVV